MDCGGHQASPEVWEPGPVSVGGGRSHAWDWRRLREKATPTDVGQIIGLTPLPGNTSLRPSRLNDPDMIGSRTSMDKALLTDNASRPAPAGDPLHDALRESRHRWRELVTLAADLAFETDAWGRFVFVMPDLALGWTSGTLLGQPGALLLAAGSEIGGFDPFRVTAPCRHRRAWIRRADGGRACLTFSVAPITDPDGRITGTRGFGIDMTELDTQA